MTNRKKPFTNSNYYIEPLSEDDFSYEDDYEYDSDYDSNDKHPNWGQSLSTLADSVSADSGCLTDLLENTDSNDFSIKKKLKLLLALEFDCGGLEVLQNFLDPAGKILVREETGLTAKQQRKISKAIRHARASGLIAHAF